MKRNILMCGSNLNVKGGMVSVVKNYLEYNNWDNYEITYIPTHVEKNKVIVILYFIIAYIKIIFSCITKKYVIAHLHTAERGSFFRKSILVRTLKKFGVKTIMHHHAAEFEQFYSKLSKKKKLYVNKTLEIVDLNIVLSKRLVSMIKEKAPNAKIEILYNAVPVYSSIPRNPEAKGVLFLGRLGKRKGTYDLLEAIKLIEKEIPKDVKFYLCGDGEIKEIKEKIIKLGLEERIAYIGWINSDEKKKIYEKIAINVLPSYNEGLPMSILEMMAYGIPSLTTAIASIPEVVFDGKNGFLIKPGEIKKMATRLKEMSCNLELCHQMGNFSYEFIVNNFSLSKNIDKLKLIYDKVLEEKID